ncbi:MAG: molecular chaperone DjiA [Rickettsiales bacterium]
MKLFLSLPKTVSKVGLNRGIDFFADIYRIPSRGITATHYFFSKKYNKLEEIHHDHYNVGIHNNNNSLSLKNSMDDVSFTFAVISLSAMVARADGGISKEEYLAFRDSFPLTGGICIKIRQLFMLACKSNIPVSSHVRQIKLSFPHKKDLFFALVERLFRIAAADKPLSKEESKVIVKIARMLDISPSDYSMLYDRYSKPLPPHVILGIEKRSPKDIIKKHYYRMIKRYHPDKFINNTLSPEIKMLLTLKTSEISQAYNTLIRKAA